ncbi:MAG: flagellar basal body-associated FliL family protein [Acidobacteria bacterium]|nr:flagellar basal body-associated FliL family protein [Acidobacteriota bacterium]
MTAVRGAAKKQAAPVAAPPPPPAAPAKKPLNTKMIAGIAVVVLLAAYFLVLKPKPASTPPAAATGTAITAGNVKLTNLDNIPHDGPVVALDSITVNLADGKFLRVGLALQLGKAGAKEGSVDPKSYGARALDSTISVMSTYTTTDLADVKGRLKAKERLTRTIVARYGGEVLGLYFTDFVMQ